MEISRQEYWGGLSFPPAGPLPDPGVGPVSPALQEDSLPTEPSHMEVSPDLTYFNPVGYSVIVYVGPMT